VYPYKKKAITFISTLDTSTLNTIALQLADMQIKVCSFALVERLFSRHTCEEYKRRWYVATDYEETRREEVVYWRPLTRCEVHAMPSVLEMTEKVRLCYYPSACGKLLVTISCGRGGVFGGGVGC
jgi:hypothetical protein